MTAGLRLRVAPIACDGRKLCAEILPELITLDDWGFPIIGDVTCPTACSTKPARPSGSAPSSPSGSKARINLN